MGHVYQPTVDPPHARDTRHGRRRRCHRGWTTGPTGDGRRQQARRHAPATAAHPPPPPGRDDPDTTSSSPPMAAPAEEDPNARRHPGTTSPAGLRPPTQPPVVVVHLRQMVPERQPHRRPRHPRTRLETALALRTPPAGRTPAPTPRTGQTMPLDRPLNPHRRTVARPTRPDDADGRPEPTSDGGSRPDDAGSTASRR